MIRATMLQIVTMLLILVFNTRGQTIRHFMGVSKVVTVKIDTKKDTVMKKNRVEKLSAWKDSTRYYKQQLHKAQRLLHKQQSLVEYARFVRHQRQLKKAGFVRLYYVICAKDTSDLFAKYGLNASIRWSQSRLSLDSTCAVIEQRINKSRIKEVKRAYKDGLIKVWGVYPDIGKVRKYLSNWKNGFVEKEVKGGKEAKEMDAKSF